MVRTIEASVFGIKNVLRRFYVRSIVLGRKPSVGKRKIAANSSMTYEANFGWTNTKHNTRSSFFR